MSDDDNNPSSGPGWLERLALALTGEPRDREELIKILRDAAERDIINDETLRMLSGVFSMGHLRVRDVMVARAQMVAVEYVSKLSGLLPIVVESGHSRFPVIGHDRDEVVGLLLANDLFQHILDRNQAGNAAVFVHDDGQMVAAGAKLGQQHIEGDIVDRKLGTHGKPVFTNIDD